MNELKSFEYSLTQLKLNNIQKPNENIVKMLDYSNFPNISSCFNALKQPCEFQTLWYNFSSKYEPGNTKLFNDLNNVYTISRVYKAWLSLIRDLHFEIMLKHNFEFVFKSEQLDKTGSDFLIVILHNNRIYNFTLNCYVDTIKSRNFKIQKSKKHKSIGIDIDVPLNLDVCKKIGPFSLYSDIYISKLGEQINEYLVG